MNRILKPVAATLLLLIPATAWAGPPYDTDDPEPTDLHHWEIYAFAAGDRIGGTTEGQTGIDLNYGGLPGVQLTTTLPLDYEAGAGTRIARGDIEVGVKYRFLHREKEGFSVAIFPRLIVPTAGKGFGTGRVQALLPVWAQKDMGPWSIFGGGGYTINPGPGNRDFWLGGLAVTRDVSRRLSLGAEMTRQGSDSVSAGGTTTLGAGGIWKLKAPFSILASAGPEWEDGRHSAGLHAYVALGLNF
ncbi:MAG TPA: hypothetical protein VFW19_00270 [Allosphingosinicella sp.]|nr:hypothetical protein [Allosphingosinicella sp.]